MSALFKASAFLPTWQTLILLLTWCAGGTRAARPIGFEEAVSRTLESNPELASLKDAREQRIAEAHAASGLPDPELELFTENLGADELELALVVPLEIGGKRRARKNLAQLNVRAAELALEEKRIALRAEVIRRYALATSLTAVCAQLDSLIALLEHDRKRIASRVAAGAAMDIDRVRAELALDENRLRRRGAAVQRDLACSSLASLWGGSPDEPWEPSARLGGGGPRVTVDEVSAAAQNHPGWAQVEMERAQSDADLAEAKAEQFPELAVTGGYKRDNAADDNIGLLGLSIGLPLFSRRGSVVSAKRHAIESVRMSIQARRRARENQVRELVTSMHLLADRIGFLEDTAVPKLERVCGDLTALYERGLVGVSDVLDSRGDLLERQMECIELQLELAQTSADLLELSGYEVTVFAN